MERPQMNIEGDWFVFRSCVNDRIDFSDLDHLEALLRVNYSLPFVKYNLNDAKLNISAELPITQLSALQLRNLASAFARCNGGSITSDKHSSGTHCTTHQETRTVITAVFRDEGCVVLRENAADEELRWTIGMPLKQHYGTRRAEVHVKKDDLIFDTDIVSLPREGIAEGIHSAIVLWLLRINAEIRYAKVALLDEQACLLVRLPLSAFTSEQCREALKALRVISERIQHEASALLQQDIAEAYMRITTSSTNAHRRKEVNSR